MIDHVLRYVVPAGYAVLPPAMASTRATAFVLAIGLQESRFMDRRQKEGGPARGFWQFEQNGVRGVGSHRASRGPLEVALRALRYEQLINPLAVGTQLLKVAPTQLVLEHNDTLAFVFARLNLWTLSGALPGRGAVDLAWRQYIAAWNPGDPKPETWPAFFEEAWERAEPAHGLVGGSSS